MKTCRDSFKVRALSLSVLAVLGVTWVSSAQTPTGDEFQVNTYTTGAQRSPAVEAAPDGDFLVAWTSDESADDPLLSVQARRYGPSGIPEGDEFMINGFTTGWQRTPSIAFEKGGGYVVAFMGFLAPGTDTSSDSIQLRRFSSTGVPLGDDFQANSYTPGQQHAPDVDVLDNGDFVVVWSSYGSFGDDDSYDSVQARLFSAVGAPLGPEMQVNTYTTSRQRPPKVAALSDGGFIVAWSSLGADNDESGFSVQARRYDETGSPLTGQFQVNTSTTGFQRSADIVANPDGGFVVVWGSTSSMGSDSSAYSVQAQRYAADSSPIGGEMQLNSYTEGTQTSPAVARIPEGGFVVSWTSDESDGSDDDQRSVRARLFDENWVALGPDWQVNQYTTSWQQAPVVAATGGHFVVSWQSDGSGGSDSSNYSVQGRRYAIESIFSDGFESGDTSAWDQVVP